MESFTLTSNNELRKILSTYCVSYDDKRSCVNCGHNAKFRCSRCNDRNYGSYCSRECQKKDHPNHKRLCYPLDITLIKDKKNLILYEARKRNLFSEFQAYASVMKDSHVNVIDKYDYARHLIYKGFIENILDDPIQANSNKGDAFILDGCKLLKRIDPKIIHDEDDLFWLFIPSQLHNKVYTLYKT